jgi:hypothetical protein
MMTNAEKLAEVEAAISELLAGGQAVAFNGRRVEMADLDALQKRERYLQEQVERESHGGIRVRGITPV